MPRARVHAHSGMATAGGIAVTARAARHPPSASASGTAVSAAIVAPSPIAATQVPVTLPLRSENRFLTTAGSATPASAMATPMGTVISSSRVALGMNARTSVASASTPRQPCMIRP